MLVQRTAIPEPRTNGSGHLVPALHQETWLPPCRVLVVDDDAMTRRYLYTSLRRELYDVELASSGEDALRLMRTTPCDIVLTDWQMPNMDGLALCRSIRGTYQQGDVYVLVLSVRHAEQGRRAALGAGADDYVVKGTPIRGVLEQLNTGRIARSRRLSGSADPALRSSVSDPSTGAHNLSFFIEQMPREIERAQYSRHTLVVLSCCIDGFEQAVARYGHDVGDEALRAFVATTNHCLRPGEGWIARVGENQFMIALRETRFKSAERVARILHQALSSVPVRTRFGPICFTVSIAVTACDAKHSPSCLSPMKTLVRTADGDSPPSTMNSEKTLTAPVAPPRHHSEVARFTADEFVVDWR
jgi:two-component system, cell cycle response regulator